MDNWYGGNEVTKAQKILWLMNPIIWAFANADDPDDIQYERIQDAVNEKGWSRSVTKYPEVANLLQAIEKELK
jgi:hypothetical protein